MNSEADVFVGITNLVEIRKELLVGTRGTIRLLREYEQYKRLRTEKLQQIVKLYKILTDINALNRKIKNSLPKVAIEEDDVPVATTDKATVLRKKTKLELLEEELATIESRLSALG